MLKVVLIAAVLGSAAPAWAGDKILKAPEPAWVKPATIRPPKADADGPAARSLLLDRQLHVGPEGESDYTNIAVQVRTPLGLMSAGSMAIVWDPSIDTVTVHHLRILRGDRTIDVLAKQDFTVIRRETNLERAMLDGMLSATLQPEGLQAGDLIDLSYTKVRNDPALQGRTDDVLSAPAFGRVDQLRLRAVWDAKLPLAWRAGEGLSKPKVSTGRETEVSVEMRDVEPVKLPLGAPRRFYPTRELSVSSFQTWGEVAALMAPLYERTSTLAPDSPLKAEVARIRAASPDPKIRAGMALQMVEDQVRYLALTMNDGGYVPATPDETWRRRFGDCKAKTVLLVAILRALYIDAEPAFVDSDGGEFLASRPPALSAFDHVIVRAAIDGKVYWLDGTRLGDRNIEAVKTPPFGQALPLRPSGAGLIALLQPPPNTPTISLAFNIDATKGIDAPASMHAEMTISGDMSMYLRLGLQSANATEREKRLKESWNAYPGVEAEKVTLVQDDATGDTRLVMDGKVKLAWFPRANGPRYLLVQTAALGGASPPKRDPGTNVDAPYAVLGYPNYAVTRYEIRLPAAGQRFTIEGDDVDKTIAGVHYLRRSKVEHGVATFETSVRTTVPEFPAAQADAARDALTEVSKVRVGLRTPANYRPTSDDVTAWAVETPKTTQDWLGRGLRYMAAGKRDLALADLAKSAELDPKSAWPAANRAAIFVGQGRFTEAQVEITKALELDARNFVAIQAQGAIALAAARYEDAIAAYSRAADLQPHNLYALEQRHRVWLLMGRIDKALADIDEIEKLEPKLVESDLLRLSIYADEGDYGKALAAADAGLVKHPDDNLMQIARAALLARMGRKAEATAAFERAIAATPTLEAYLTRARTRPRTDLTGRLADVELAAKLEPKSPVVTGERASFLAQAGRYDEALTTLNKAVAANPDDHYLVSIRADIYARAGRARPATADYEVLRKEAKTAEALNAICWKEATREFALKTALADCDAALAIAPRNAAIIDSRAFVLMRMGRLQEALAGYDAALTLRPNWAETLLGRGMTLLRLGEEAAGRADVAEALRRKPDLAEVWSDYGLPPPTDLKTATVGPAMPSR